MTNPMPAMPSSDAVADTIDTTAATTNSAIDRAAAASTELVDKAAEAAKNAERTARSGGRAALDAGQDALRAGLGVAGAVGEQAGRLLSALVDRGTAIEQKVVEKVKDTASTATEAVRSRVSEVRQAVDTRADEASTRVGDAVEETVAGPLAGAMRRVGVPTRAELRELSAAVAALAAKVDGLVARLDGAPVLLAAEEAVIVPATGAAAGGDVAEIVAPDGVTPAAEVVEAETAAEQAAAGGKRARR